jgi:hypothetical protein
MKAILVLLAVIALASARLNGADVYMGFTSKLGFSVENHKEAQACALEVSTGVKSLFSHGKSALNAKIFNFIMADDAKHREVIVNIQTYLKAALPSCKKFIFSLAPIFSKTSLTVDEMSISPNKLFGYRFAKYSDVIVSSIFKIEDDIKAGNGKQVGATIANLFQILTGLTHPESVQDYIRNYKSPMEVSVIEVDTFIQKTINTAAKELGYTQEVPIHRVKDLREAAQHFAVVLMTAQAQFHKSSGLLQKEVVVLGAFRDLIKVAGVVLENVKLILTPYVQKNHARGDVRTVAYRVLHNYYASFPTLERRAIDIAMGIKSHKPVQTGKAIAEIVSLLVATHHNH